MKILTQTTPEQLSSCNFSGVELDVEKSKYYLKKIGQHFIVEDMDNGSIVDLVKQHFKYDFTSCVYPAKSYFVAIVYSYGFSLVNKTSLLEELRKINFTDLYTFVPYNKDPETYNQILDGLEINPNKGTVPITLNCFYEEFNFPRE